MVAKPTRSDIVWSDRLVDVCYVGPLTDAILDHVLILRRNGINVEVNSAPNREEFFEGIYRHSRFSLCVDAPLSYYIEAGLMGCIILGEDRPEVAELKASGAMFIADDRFGFIKHVKSFITGHISGDFETLVNRAMRHHGMTQDEAMRIALSCVTTTASADSRPGKNTYDDARAMKIIERAYEWAKSQEYDNA